MEIRKYVDPNYKGPKLLQRYLKKLKSGKSLSKIFSNFNKRFFVLDLEEYVFYYKEKEFSNIIEEYSLMDLVYLETKPKVIKVCDWKFTFSIKIKRRIFILHTDSVSAHEEWCSALKACIRPSEKANHEPPKIQFIQAPVNKPYTQEIENNRRMSMENPIPKEAEEINDRNFRTREYDKDYHRKTGEMMNGHENFHVKDYGTRENHEDPYKNLDFHRHQNKLPMEEDSIQSQFVNKKQQTKIVDYATESYKNTENVLIANLNLREKERVFERPKIESKFLVIKNGDHKDYSKKTSVRETSMEDEYEIRVISESKCKHAEDDIGDIPIIHFKERNSEKEENIKPVFFQEEVFETGPLKNKDNKEGADMLKTGIVDLINEIGSLGFENLEVRSISRPKTKEASQPIKNTKGTKVIQDTKDQQEVKFFHEARKKRFSYDREFGFKNTSNGKPIKKISLKPMNKVKVSCFSYVEKPEMVPDNFYLNEKKNSIEIPRRHKPAFSQNKKNISYKEARPRLQSKSVDCDWDDWDN